MKTMHQMWEEYYNNTWSHLDRNSRQYDDMKANFYAGALVAVQEVTRAKKTTRPLLDEIETYCRQWIDKYATPKGRA